LREVVTDGLGLSGSWYLVALGAVAMATVLFAPAGLWPMVRDRWGVEWLSVRRRPLSRRGNCRRPRLLAIVIFIAVGTLRLFPVAHYGQAKDQEHDRGRDQEDD